MRPSCRDGGGRVQDAARDARALAWNDDNLAVAALLDATQRGLHEVVSFLDVRGLRGEHLAQGQRKRCLDGVIVDLSGRIFALLGGGEQSVIAPAQLEFQSGPGAVHGARSCAAFAQVADAFPVEDRFQFAAKLSASERFSEKKALQISVFKLSPMATRAS